MCHYVDKKTYKPNIFWNLLVLPPLSTESPGHMHTSSLHAESKPAWNLTDSVADISMCGLRPWIIMTNIDDLSGPANATYRTARAGNCSPWHHPVSSHPPTPDASQRAACRCAVLRALSSRCCLSSSAAHIVHRVRHQCVCECVCVCVCVWVCVCVCVCVS